eukprot:jgi/Picsp_1/1333/NSC_04813-R1_serine palmitoyltransferase 1-like
MLTTLVLIFVTIVGTLLLLRGSGIVPLYAIKILPRGGLGSFGLDGVKMEHILSYLDDPVALYQDCWNLLRPGGAWHPAEFIEHKGHLVLEGALLLIILYFMAQRSSKPQGQKSRQVRLTEQEIDELCEEWEPEPLSGTVTAFQQEWLKSVPVVSSHGSKSVRVNGKHGVLNFCTTNFLGLADDPRIQQAGEKTIGKYGVGSCGPRGFYGTIDVHLELEEKIANFMKTEESILYSYDAATVPSIIPAFANARDIIVLDDGCCNAIRSGCTLSRAKVVTSPHNDLVKLEEVLKRIIKEEEKVAKPLNRRFIVVEGIYQNTGEIAPLKEIVRIKNKYKFRLLVDESVSFGVLGTTGRGAIEHFGVDPSDVEIIAASLGNSAVSIGGFCAGSREIVDHQRLSGLGYCFSASLPPYLASTSMAALDVIEMEGTHRMKKLQENAKYFRESLASSKTFHVAGGAASLISPLIHVRLHPSSTDKNTWDDEELILQRIVNHCLDCSHVLLAVAKYSKLDSTFRPAPSIKVTVTTEHSKADIDQALRALHHAHGSVIG